MEQRIKKAVTDSDWDVIYVNISCCCSSPSLFAWFDLLSILRFLFTITHSSLIASCSANRVHCTSSCYWQRKKALSLILILSGFFHSIFTTCLLYTSLPLKAPCEAFRSIFCCCLASSVFISSFQSADSNTAVFCLTISLWNGHFSLAVSYCT